MTRRTRSLSVLALAFVLGGCVELDDWDWDLDFGCDFLDFEEPLVADDGREVGAGSAFWFRGDVWAASGGHELSGADGWRLEEAEEVSPGDGECEGPRFRFALDEGTNVLRWRNGESEAQVTLEARAADRLETYSSDRDEAGVLRLEAGGDSGWLVPELFDAEGAALVPPMNLEAWASDDIVTIEASGIALVHPEAPGETTVLVRVAGVSEVIDVVVSPAADAGP